MSVPDTYRAGGMRLPIPGQGADPGCPWPVLRVAHFIAQNAYHHTDTGVPTRHETPESTGASGPDGHIGRVSVIS